MCRCQRTPLSAGLSVVIGVAVARRAVVEALDIPGGIVSIALAMRAVIVSLHCPAAGTTAGQPSLRSDYNLGRTL